MTITTDIFSITVVVRDQDRARAFYCDVLGCRPTYDDEPLPGERLVEVTPPGSRVPIALVKEGSGLPIGVRYRTPDAERAHRELRAAGVTPHQDEVLYLEGAPPMFTFPDPEGNTLILMQDAPDPAVSLPASGIAACVPVRELAVAEGFYERLFGRPADERPMDGLAEWHQDGFIFQVTVDADRAGGGLVTIQLPDLRAAADGARARGVRLDGPTDGTAVKAYAGIDDPDGNRITLVEA